jgi:hypothetical protein
MIEEVNVINSNGINLKIKNDYADELIEISLPLFTIIMIFMRQWLYS